MAAALAARSRLASGVMPDASAERKYPVNVSPAAVDNRPIAKALLETYFRNGGQQAMINVLRRGDLEDAIAHPENHQSLMVRVGGFSARFVTLAPDVQREIASRTLY